MVNWQALGTFVSFSTVILQKEKHKSLGTGIFNI